MKLLLNKIHFPVTTLGFGRRIGIWFQGCTLQCKGCISRDTWPASPEYATTVGDVLSACESLGASEPDGVTISGGEPFEQPEALAALVDGLNQWRTGLSNAIDILVYSGLPFTRLELMHQRILRGVDAVISEPFIERKAPGGRWAGSANQRLSPLSDKGREKYAGWSPSVSGTPEVQVSVEPQAIWFIGVPRPGDLVRLEHTARQRGIELGAVSWRA